MPERVVVLGPNWLGDTVMALPAIADLRRAFPSAHLAVAARESLTALFSVVPDVDEVVTLEAGSLSSQVRAVAAGSFDTAVLLPNSFRAAWLAWRAGVRERWGYRNEGRGVLLTRAVSMPAGPSHQAAYYQALTTRLGVPPGPPEPLIDVPATVLIEARALLSTHGRETGLSLVALAPGAAFGSAKQWPAAYVASLASMIAATPGLACVLVGGRWDLETGRAVQAALDEESRARVIDLIGRTTLPVMIGVLAEADACVANDSAAMHLAAAVGTAVAGIFGPTDERLTAPVRRPGRRTAVLAHEVWCRPCMLRTCAIGHHCMLGVSPDRARATVDTLLS